MLIVVPAGGSFDAIYSNVADGVQPANAMGTSCIPGASNTYGSYTSLLAGASVLTEGYGLWLNINSGAQSAEARDQLWTIGLDLAGGTSFTDFIPHLIASCAAVYRSGHTYYFPIRIPAGASIGAKGSVNAATARTARIYIKVYAKPRSPQLTRVGSAVQAIGITTGTSAGTAVTLGTTSEGSWTSLGTVTQDSWWFQVGLGVNDATMSDGIYTVDLGTGSTQNVILANSAYGFSNAETLANEASVNCLEGYRDVLAGETIYGRGQASVTPDSNISLAAYALR